MCNPLAIGLLAAGAGSKAYGNYQTNKAMNNALENGVMRQGQLQGQLNDNILKGAERDFSVGNQEKNYEDAAQTRSNSIVDILNQYGANAGEVENTGTGDAFSLAKAQAKVKQLEDSTRLAGLMGRAGAYGDSGQQRQLNIMNDADIASAIGQDMRRSQQQTQWDLDKASQKGANANLIGDLMMMAGTMNPSLGGLGNFGKTAVGGSGANATRMFGAFA